MLKRIKPLGWLVIIGLIWLLLTGMSHLTNNQTKQAINQNDLQTDIQLKDKIPSTYPGIRLGLEMTSSDAYHITIQRPSTKSTVVNDKLWDWIDAQKDRFIEKFANTGDDNKEETPFLKMDVHAEQMGSDAYNLIFTKDESGQRTETKVFNVDIKQNHVVRLADILKMDEATMKTLREQTVVSLEEQDIAVNADALDSFFSNPDAWNWTINRTAFTLYIDTDNGTAPVKAAIPIEKLYLHFTDDITGIVNMSDEKKQEMNDAIEAEKERIRKEEAEQKERKRKEQEKKEAEERTKQEAKEKQQNKKPDDNGGKYVALTFDDGPSSEVTPRVLDTLAQYGAKATFFMIGSEVDAHPETAKQVAEAGHEIGNHTVDHADLSKLGQGDIRAEVGNSANSIEQATGVRPYFVRPPYGAYNNAVKSDATNNSNSLILWSVDSRDWQSLNANSVISEVQKQVTSGAIVLMHDIHPSTADALPELLNWLKSQGYQFVTVSQLLEKQGQDGVGPFYGSVK